MKGFNEVVTSVSQEQWTEISKLVHSELQAISCTETAEGDDTLRHSAAVHLLDSYRIFLSTAHLVGGGGVE